jgi:hypothetical protein
MDGADTPRREDPVWLVLTPSADDAAWRAAIRAGVEASGLVLRDADRDVPASTDDPAREVWLTSDCDVVESLGRRPAAVLIPRPETSPEAVAERLGIFPPQSVAQASLLLARAVSQDPRRTRIFTAGDIAASRGLPLTLAGGLSVTPPPPQPVEAVRPAVRVALQAFSGGAPTPGQQVVWSERLFRYDQRAARGAQQMGELDITGRPRILVYGPYLGLPPGRWRTRVRFLVDATAATKEFRLDWGTPHDFASLAVTPPHAGVFEAELEHDWPTVAFGELRLWLMEGAFDGVLHFLGANLTFVGRTLANAA